MSFTAYADSQYQATRMSADEEREYIKERSCKHPIPHDCCDADPAATKLCEGGCGKYFCEDHLFNGECKACFVLNESAAEVAA